MSGSSASLSSSPLAEESSTSLVLLLFVGLVLVSVFVSLTFSQVRFLSWLPESTAVLGLSTAVGALSLLGTEVSSRIPQLSLSAFSTTFSELLLPLIIFQAGLTVRKRRLVANIGAIGSFAFLGTFITAAVLAVLIWASKVGPSKTHGFMACLLFASLLACTDTVATLATMVELNVDPQLYSLVFGESVLNDAVSIALFRTLQMYVDESFSGKTVLLVAKDFGIIVALSTGIGLGVALACAMLVARLRSRNISSTFEISFVFGFAYLSWLVADVCGGSGVISIFVCAIITSHYTWYSMSQRSRVSLFTFSTTLDYLATTVVFVALGLSIFERKSMLTASHWDLPFILVTIGGLLVGRAAAIFPLALLLNIGRKAKIPFKHQLVMWWCGMRGPVSLILALDVKLSCRTVMVNCVYACIAFTNVVVGIATKPLVARLHVGSDVKDVNIKDLAAPDEADPNAPLLPSTNSDEPVDETPRRQSSLVRLWHKIDERALKPLFGGKPRSGEAKREFHRQQTLRQSRKVIRTTVDCVYNLPDFEDDLKTALSRPH